MTPSAFFSNYTTGCIVTLHFSPAHHVTFWFWLGGVETAPKQPIFITFLFSEVKTSPKY